jgi:Ca2+-binding EF-hand superfamily protein
MASAQQRQCNVARMPTITYQCSESDIQRVLNIFDRLDVDGDGELNANDIVARRLTLTGAQGEGLPVA